MKLCFLTFALIHASCIAPNLDGGVEDKPPQDAAFALAPQQHQESPPDMPEHGTPQAEVEEERQWPEAPTVSILYDARGEPATELEFEFEPEAWEERAGRRFCKTGQTTARTQFIVWLEQIEDLDATRVTVAAINGLSGVGPAYFEQYRISVDGKVLDDIEGQHVIPPRYALFRRTSTGPDASVLIDWTYLPRAKGLPIWARTEAGQDTVRRMKYEFDLGPYQFFWSNRSLYDSHGGQGVGPFHGGPEDWLQCPEGRRNRELEMLLDFQRPIWMLTADYEPYSPKAPYWMGRTDPHEPPGYRYELDDWCGYAKRLSGFKFADHTHLSRGTGGAGALAAYDIVGEACLEMVFTDFKTAHSLEPGHPGTKQGNFLLRPLWQKIKLSNGPGNGGDRGLAHKLRLLRWCRPYFDTEPYDVAMRAWVRKLCDQYGMTNSGNAPWAEGPGVLTHPLAAPTSATFHQQLVTYEIGRFGGLDDLARAGRRFLKARPPAAFEVRAGDSHDTVFDRRNSVTGQSDPRWSYEAYGHLTHGVLLTHKTAAEFRAANRDRGVNGSSQDFDSTPRSLWAPRPLLEKRSASGD